MKISPASSNNKTYRGVPGSIRTGAANGRGRWKRSRRSRKDFASWWRRAAGHIDKVATAAGHIDKAATAAGRRSAFYRNESFVVSKFGRFGNTLDSFDGSTPN